MAGVLPSRRLYGEIFLLVCKCTCNLEVLVSDAWLPPLRTKRPLPYG
jgi:hypothetical protein